MHLSDWMQSGLILASKLSKCSICLEAVCGIELNPFEHLEMLKLMLFNVLVYVK